MEIFNDSTLEPVKTVAFARLDSANPQLWGGSFYVDEKYQYSYRIAVKRNSSGGSPTTQYYHDKFNKRDQTSSVSFKLSPLI